MTAEEVRRLVADTLGCAPEMLPDSAGPGRTPGWDSLAQVAIIAAMEAALGLRFSAARLVQMGTVSELVRVAAEVEMEPLPPRQAEQLPLCSVAPQGERQLLVCTVMQWAEVQPTKAAIVFTEESLTYLQLAEGARRVAAGLRQRGIKPGDVVALYAEKSRGFCCAYWGAQLAGAAVLNLDPALRPELLASLREQARPALVVGHGLGAEASYAEVAVDDAEAQPLAPPPWHAVAELMCTTGTTGRPKVVRLTHANLSATASHINAFLGVHEGDVEALALPIHRSFGMGRLRCVLAAGGTLVMADGFSCPQKLFDLLRRCRATGLAMVPASWAYLRRMSGDALAAHAVCLSYIELGSAPMPRAEKERLMQLFPHAKICMHYGLTEASRSTFIDFHAEADKLDTAGRPADGVSVVICGEGGTPLPAGVEGEVCIAGPHVCRGYLDEVESSSFYGDLFRTGDSGWMDAEGYLHLSGRLKDIINVGGKKVSPAEVEAVLCEAPGVAEAACVPAPDAQGICGEVVRAVLVAEPGMPRLSAEALVRFVRARGLEAHQIPAIVEWVDALPRTASGKLQRHLVL